MKPVQDVTHDFSCAFLGMARRFLPPWTVKSIPGGFKVNDARDRLSLMCMREGGSQVGLNFGTLQDATRPSTITVTHFPVREVAGDGETAGDE